MRLSNRKSKGVLVVEFTFLMLILTIVALSFYSLTLAIDADKKFYSVVDDAAKSEKNLIYIAAQIKANRQDTSKLAELSADSIKKVGILDQNVPQGKGLTKQLLEQHIKYKSNKKLQAGSAGSYFNDDVKIDVTSKDNIMVVKSCVSVRLPVISKLAGKIVLKHNHYISASGIDVLLSDGAKTNQFDFEKNIYVTRNARENTFVYHTKSCFAMRTANLETTEFYQRERYSLQIEQKGDIEIAGKSYKLCPFCRK